MGNVAAFALYSFAFSICRSEDRRGVTLNDDNSSSFVFATSVTFRNIAIFSMVVTDRSDSDFAVLRPALMIGLEFCLFLTPVSYTPHLSADRI